MPNAQYVWSVAKALRERVRPSVTESSARDALDNGIRVLTAMANALEPGPVAPATFDDQDARADTDRLNGPAENAAAYRSNGALIARLAGQIQDGASDAGLVSACRWERDLLDAAIARFDAVERAVASEAAATSHNIDPDRLGAYLRTLPGCGDVRVSDFRLIVGGRSRQTALFAIEGGAGLPRKMVIQRGIPGQMAGGAFLDEAQQYDLLKQLFAAGMRVPQPVLVETDPHWLDASFLLAEQVEGVTVQPDYWLPADSEAVALDLARQMAILHSQPVETVGAGLRQTRDLADSAGLSAEIERFAAIWNDGAHWPSITMSAAIAFLRKHADCVDDRRAIVHNDMVFHNILAKDDRITAVLDWEQCAIGHPGEDLGYCYPVVIGVTPWPKFMAAYRDAGGADIPQQQIDFFALRAGLRLMGLVMVGGRDTFEKGLSDDVLVASAGAHFTQRLLHRIAIVLNSILDRTDER